MNHLALIEWMIKPVHSCFCERALKEMSSAGVNNTNKKFIKCASVISHAFFGNTQWRELMQASTVSHGKPFLHESVNWIGVELPQFISVSPNLQVVYSGKVKSRV